MLFYVGNFSYTPCAASCGEFLLHARRCFMWRVSLTRLKLFYVGSFSYTLRAVLCGEESLTRRPCCFMWGVCLTCPYCFNMWGVSLTRPCCFMLGVSLTRPVLFYVGSFSYMPLAVLCAEFLLHALCYTHTLTHTHTQWHKPLVIYTKQTKADQMQINTAQGSHQTDSGKTDVTQTDVTDTQWQHWQRPESPPTVTCLLPVAYEYSPRP